ncbi:hypothetical protein B0J12DRAFT_458816 [Macrophomina phaseolina]|uniref:Uncharacterized protein n=1 Tax=Macrophomina phaseolina TaxID=35725 RepID=A0ABQ8GG46_9PEZI|nr:hypothetical protein B0J12DRAFT_458816 [Macrophomina phaseolina]
MKLFTLPPLLCLSHLIGAVPVLPEARVQAPNGHSAGLPAPQHGNLTQVFPQLRATEEVAARFLDSTQLQKQREETEHALTPLLEFKRDVTPAPPGAKLVYCNPLCEEDLIKCFTYGCLQYGYYMKSHVYVNKSTGLEASSASETSNPAHIILASPTEPPVGEGGIQKRDNQEEDPNKPPARIIKVKSLDGILLPLLAEAVYGKHGGHEKRGLEGLTFPLEVMSPEEYAKVQAELEEEKREGQEAHIEGDNKEGGNQKRNLIDESPNLNAKWDMILADLAAEKEEKEKARRDYKDACVNSCHRGVGKQKRNLQDDPFRRVMFSQAWPGLMAQARARLLGKKRANVAACLNACFEQWGN